jgi:hypothetical protein
MENRIKNRITPKVINNNLGMINNKRQTKKYKKT